MKTRDLFSEWFREAFSENEEERLQAMKERVSRETGIPADMLSGDTEDSCRAYAGRLSAFVQTGQQAAALTAELEALKAENAAREIRDIRERVSRETGIPADMLSGDTEDSCRAYAAQLTAYAKPYPVVRDAALYGDMIPDGRSAGEKFAEWFGQVSSFDPFKGPGGWKRII